MSQPRSLPRWGQPPWTIDFRPQPSQPPDYVDFAIIGGGFTGLAAAASLRRLDPAKSVAVFEAESIGAGSSGRTGGLALAETAAGDLPGLGDVLAGFSNILKDLGVSCALALPGVWELDRATSSQHSSIRWEDSGQLRVARDVPGGTIDPGSLVSGLARAAVQRGALVYEAAPVDRVAFGGDPILSVRGQQIRANRILFATNAESLQLNELAGKAQPKLTLAMATESLSDERINALGLASGKPFYTVDLPYLWGRLLEGHKIIFGSGLVNG